jgi:protein O-GlcNAc transferase
MNRKSRRAAQSMSRSAPQGDPLVLRDFREAVEHLQAGRLHQSEIAHKRVLERQPRHAPSLHHLGLIAFKTNARHEAVEYIRQSVAVDPGYHQAWMNLAVILGELRRTPEAIEACKRCIALRPDSAEPHAVLGNLNRSVDNYADAIAAYSQSLTLNPNQPVILVRCGEALLHQGKAAEALTCSRRALAIDPKFEDAQRLEGRILASTGRLEAADALVASQSDDPAERAKFYDDLGTYLRAQGRHAEAVDIHRRAVACQPEKADWLFNLAVALEGNGQNEEALAAYQAGLAIEPERAEAYANVGCLLRNMDALNGAITALEHSVKLDPTLAHGHYNLAVTYKQLNRFEEAHAAFAKAVECAPDSLINRIEFHSLRRVVCDWDGLQEEEDRCLELYRAGDVAVAPFQLLSMRTDRADQLEAARRFARKIVVPDDLKFRSYPASAETNRRIRVGFLSSDFFEHATALLIVEVLEKFDRNRFELFGYCYSPDDGTELRQRIRKSFDHIVDIGHLSRHEAARVIHGHGIDVLVDLKGYTRDTRSDILAYAPAPIQVNFLGYPGTMGADFAHYILGDPIVTPMDHQEHYAERIVQLPHSYQPNDRQRKISDAPITRADCGLPEDAFVFCSFNNSYKTNAATFDIWMRLLGKVPGSVLWMLTSNEMCRENLRREAAARGIDPNRLVFAGRMPVPEHLARHRLADLFLDSLPYNAHTTTSDALWAGLPVLTCIGETFAGRVAASLLTAMGVPEMITHSLEEYEQTALAFAEDRSRLAAIRQKIADLRNTSALFDSTRYTRNLERAFETMVDIMRSGEAPRPFAVTEDQAKAPAAPVVPLANPRVLYEQCPLCDHKDIPHHIEARITGHALYKPQLPPTMKWRSCTDCGHVFAEGYFTPEACEVVFSSTHANQKAGNDAEGQRRVSARMVERIARYAPGGDWLDIGVGNGSLLFTAAEWGYRAVGTDLRTENVETLRKIGFEAYACDIEEIEAVDRFSVVSMADVLEHVPFPRRSLTAVNRMMKRGGALFVSMPNMDTIVWRILDAAGTNPYWGEIEHYHNFTRERLVRLLEAHGFKFVEYNISERYRTCMEVIALKV